MYIKDWGKNEKIEKGRVFIVHGNVILPSLKKVVIYCSFVGKAGRCCRREEAVGKQGSCVQVIDDHELIRDQLMTQSASFFLSTALLGMGGRSSLDVIPIMPGSVLLLDLLFSFGVGGTPLPLPFAAPLSNSL